MLPTYKINLLENKAQKSLRIHSNKVLSQYKLSYNDWIILGILYDKGSARLYELAKTLNVEAPFITVIVDSLEKHKLIIRKKDPFDKRAQLIALSKKAKVLVPKVEKQLQNSVSSLVKLIGKQDYNSYLSTLEKFSNKLDNIK